MKQKPKMQSPCIKEASEHCFHGCFPSLPEPPLPTAGPTSGATSPRSDFKAATTSSLGPLAQFTNHESLPSLGESFSNFNKSYPQYSQTNLADEIRAQDYYHLARSSHVCLDYIGTGLFSYSEQQNHYSKVPISKSSFAPFFDILYKSISLNSQLHGGDESEFESKLRKRIMSFMNVSEDDYSMVFTANKSSAFKLLAENYPFDSNRNLITVYDHESEAVEAMTEIASKRRTHVKSAEFSWPRLRIQTGKLRKMVVSKRKKKRHKGLFVFPLLSSITGTRYSYLWMSIAQENGWHVLLDATALGAKDMETLGLSLFHPDFLICSFFKIFGENPSGFACLFIKKSSSPLFNNSRIETSRGIVSLVPSQFELPKQDFAGPSTLSEIVELDNKSIKSLSSSQSTSSEKGISGNSEFQCRGLDHADSLGLMLISTRLRYLVNWLVHAFLSLHHPNSENGLPLVRIYGPKVRIDRAPAVAFNLFDWKGEKIDPKIVQKLADRNNVTLGIGFLHHIWFADKFEEDRERLSEKTSVNDEERMGKRRADFVSGIHVLTASPGFLTNFEDMYRLWVFVSRFLDADFVEKERWRYMALNQRIIEF